MFFGEHYSAVLETSRMSAFKQPGPKQHHLVGEITDQNPTKDCYQREYMRKIMYTSKRELSIRLLKP